MAVIKSFAQVRFPIVPSLILLGVIGWTIADPLNLATGLRGIYFDIVQGFANPQATEKAPTKVHLVEIDTASIEKLGTWPWPRTRLGDLVAAVSQSKVKAILLDFPLDRPDPTSPENVRRHIKLVLPGAAAGSESGVPFDDHDGVLAASLKGTPSIWPVRPVRTKDGSDAPGLPALPYRMDIGDQGAVDLTRRFDGVALPLPIYRTNVQTFGIESLPPLSGNPVRKLKAFSSIAGQPVASDVMETVRIAAGADGYVVASKGEVGEYNALSRNGMSDVKVGDLTIPLNSDGTFTLISRDASQLPRLSASTVLSDHTTWSSFDDAVVVISRNLPDFSRHYDTVATSNLSSGEIKALALDQIFSGRGLVRPEWAAFTEQAVLLVVGIIVLGLALQGRGYIGAGVGVLGAAAILYAGWLMFTSNGWLFDGATAAIGLLLMAGATAFDRHHDLALGKRRLLQAMGRRLPERVAATVGQIKPEEVFAGRTQKVTVMVCDLRGAASFAEIHRKDAPWMTRILNRFHTHVADKITESGGIADNETGTAILGIWNAFEEEPEHATRACDCAVKIIDSLHALNQKIELEARATGQNDISVHVAIGINTGFTIVGNLGSEYRTDFSAFGDTVTVARKLRTYSEVYGTAIIIGEHTQSAVQNRHALLELDRLTSDGSEHAVKTFAMLGNPVIRANPGFKALEHSHNELLKAYRTQNWDLALRLLTEIRKLPSAIPTLYDFYEQRIEFFRRNPPPTDWDGTFRPPVL